MSLGMGIVRTLSVHSPKSGVSDTPLRHVRQVQLADQIRANWIERLENVLQTGNSLIEGRFTKSDYQRYALPFSYSWGRKLVKIARSPRILNPANRFLLPDKADALYQIVLLSDRLFELGVTEGVIHNQSLVVDIKHFRQSFVEPGKSRRRRITVVCECQAERHESAVDMLDAFITTVQQMAHSRFPRVTLRRPRTMKELACN
jgi:hypothetical protein